MTKLTIVQDDREPNPLEVIGRTTAFWTRATSIYLGYKVAQVQALGLKMLGWSSDRLKTEHWAKQHARAGRDMYQLCVDLRGFYLKSGQFIGARGDFVPEQICRQLSVLHDQVPPMQPELAQECIERELGGIPLDSVFEWINFQDPLGSASISQVHKAKLRCHRGKPSVEADACMVAGHPGSGPRGPPPADMVTACAQAPADGLVAVKIQYPNALPTMALDLKNLRLFANFLSKTEIKFDMVSAVDELAGQIKLEFDFQREARVMDSVARAFEPIRSRIEVPKSIPGLVTDRLLVMNFLDGVPITKMRDAKEFQNLSVATKRMAARRVLSRVSEAYGRMILLDGLFQADGHPGNILVMKGGKIGLIDYGQSKRLPDTYRAAFAGLVIALAAKQNVEISRALDRLGLVVTKPDHDLKAKLARGMFDTRGRINPFDPDSPIKKAGIEKFPKDMFFVLRVVQLLRGLANGMGIVDFSSSQQWKPFAEETKKKLKSVPFPS